MVKSDYLRFGSLIISKFSATTTEYYIGDKVVIRIASLPGSHILRGSGDI